MADSAPAPTAPAAPPPPPPSRNPLRRCYAWILSWAHHPAGTWALAVFAFLDSFIFPIPPLFLQVALSLERPRRSFWYAFVDTTASVLGAVAGYWIGYAFWDLIGVRIVGPIPEPMRLKLQNNAFVVTLLYSFIPLPFKLITLGSGFLQLSLPVLLLASTLGRSARFFALGALCFFYGPRVKIFIERYFNAVCLGIGVLVAAVLAVLKLAPQLLGR
jgi:membrane protein YqaA with SNARE-associated domain